MVVEVEYFLLASLCIYTTLLLPKEENLVKLLFWFKHILFKNIAIRIFKHIRHVYILRIRTQAKLLFVKTNLPSCKRVLKAKLLSKIPVVCFAVILSQ